jgi:hypothetical protein
LTDALGIALGVGVGGAAVAVFSHSGRPVSTGILLAFAASATAGLVALLVSRRLPGTIARVARTSVSR